MIGHGLQAGVLQHVGDFFDPLARLAVNDTGLSGVLGLDKAQQLARRVGLFDNAVADVGPVKAADEFARVFQLEPLDHVLARQRVGGGSQCHARHVWKAFVQQAQRAVFGPEVVAPLAHAMRLVNRKQAEQPALVQRSQQALHARRVDALGRGIQQRQLVAQQLNFECAAFFLCLRGVEKRRRHTGLMQRADLVVHQRDQRRNHDGHAVAGLLARNGRYLVAQRLAAACGHQDQRVAACHSMVDDGFLRAAKAVVAEDLAQNVQR